MSAAARAMAIRSNGHAKNTCEKFEVTQKLDHNFHIYSDNYTAGIQVNLRTIHKVQCLA